MRALLKAFVISIPFTIIGVYIGGKLVVIYTLLGFIIALFSLLNILANRYTIHKEDIGWMLCFSVFLLVSAISLIFSPFLDRSWPKGSTQIIGVIMMILVSISILNEVRSHNTLFVRLAKISIITMGIIGAAGIVQFLALNVLNIDWKVFDLSFMNDIAGGSVWRASGHIGDLYRAHSIATEPARFAQFLGFSVGLALVRLGLFGHGLRTALRKPVPLWAAWCVVLGILVSLSIVGYIMLTLTALAGEIASRRVDFKFLIRNLSMIGILSGSLIGLIALGGGKLLEKLGTVPLVLSGISEGSESLPGSSLSALAMASNIRVMLENIVRSPIFGAGIGAHPAAYEVFAPSYVYLDQFVTGLNAPSAGGLLVRLLSETGIAGAVLYIAGFSIVVFRGRRAILDSLRVQGTVTPVTAVCIGILASCAGLFLTSLMRTGVYYYPTIWTLLALSACVPYILRHIAAGTRQAAAGRFASRRTPGKIVHERMGG